jgi:hypothetical protein
MIDPELKYCPQCDDEYMPEIVQCAACGVELITGRMKIDMLKEQERKRAAAMEELSPEDDLVSIRRGPLGEIKHLGNRLNDAMIATLIAGDENSCGKGCCPSTFYLQVRRQDAMEAMAVLQEEFRQTTALEDHDTSHVDNIFDTSASEANCPACGYAFPTTSTECPDCGLSLGV